jgi:hypothetical protein
MKKIVFGFLQFLLFVLVLLLVPIWNPLGLHWFVTHPAPTITRFFAPEGVLMALALYIAILVMDLLRKRVLSSGFMTTVAFLLALLVSYTARFGFFTHDIF